MIPSKSLGEHVAKAGIILKEIVITSDQNQIRAAVLEDGKLVEILDDTDRESRLNGNIYRGKVSNIVSGIQAAFIDIGLGKNAFLFAGDVAVPGYIGEQEEPSSSILPIESLLKEGQEVIVQIMREPVGSKGARVTTHLTLPGRFVVLLPGKKDYVSVSRKIKDEKERQRLQYLGNSMRAEGASLIIRTLAEGVTEKEFIEDVEKLLLIQKELEQKINNKSCRGLLYGSGDPFSRLLRETIDEEVDRIIIDDGDLAENLRRKLKAVRCSAAAKVWTDLKGDLFERYHIDNEILCALQARVPLESGGYLVIEQTEALTVVDVNSGKYIGNRSLQETFLHLNLEACLEISRQIRLRNLSGIIILDFIDMETSEDQEKLLDCLDKTFLKDKVRCKVMGLTRLGLVEVTRKKEGQTLAARYTIACQKCGGKGWLQKNL